MRFRSSLVFCVIASVTTAQAKEPVESNINYAPAKSLSKLMKPAIEAKDAPATCWYLGQVRGFALAARYSGNLKAQGLVTMTSEDGGKCGGKNTLNVAETFTAEEWKRLLELQKKIEAYNE